VNRPHRLASPFVVNNSDGQDWSAADLAEAADDAFVALQAGYGTGRGGVIVHDDNTGPDAGQTVYLPFNLARAPETDARRLLENIFVYLLYDEPAGPSSISGRVILAGREDHSGVTVRNGMNQSTTTAADGSFTLSGLWGGQYTITAEAEGFAPSQRSLFLAEGETYDDASYYLLPVVAADYPQTPGLAIPDNDPGGVTLTVEVAEAGQLLGIDVDMDINHYSIGHLVVTLTSPSGTTVTLHNRTGETTDDLIGNWPGTLFVDGPGELSDFVGPSPQGAWTLHVSDNALGAIGTLNAWSLNLLVTPSGATAVEGGETAPRATRLVGNAPNPFNPRTVIAFEMAAPGRAVVEVFDVRGRLVAGLADGAYVAGRHELVWDGRTTAGEEAASGLYFSRLRTDAGTQVHKMTLVR
jgi:subtilisin-like proprotein convertase family protein